MTHDTYFPTYWKPFAIYDQDTQSLRTFEDTLISDLTPFSATLPQSGMMRNGVLFELPKSERLTKGQGSTLLRTPVASESSGGIVPYDKAKENGNQISLTAQIQKFIPTPLASDAENPLKLRNQMNITKAMRMLPTPTVSDTFTGNLKSTQQKPGSMHSVTLPQAAKLIPTPRVSSANGATAKEVAAGNPKSRLEAVRDWAEFEPAIRRWEALIGRPAPAPLIEERLNPEFTEWMMGLPEGWITDLDLSWTQQIKACGNGVVPQAAAEALSRLT